MEISITWNLCRVCLQEERKNSKTNNEQMRNIFHEDKTLVHYIYEFSGIFMKPNDSLPEKICLKCLNMINKAVQFRKTCRKSNAFLLSILERTKNASVLFKPKISQQEDIEDEEEKMEVEDTDFEDITIEGFKPVPQQEDKTLEKPIKDEEPSEERNFKMNDSVSVIEEIIEESEESSDETFIRTTTESLEEILPVIPYKEDNNKYSNSNNKDGNAKTIDLQNLIMNESFTKLENTEEEPEMVNDESNITGIVESNTIDANDKELCYLLKLRKNENLNTKNLKDADEQLKENEEKCELYEIEEPEEYDAEEDNIIEDLVVHLEDEEYDDKDNQAQVSSTVETNDDIVYNHDDISHESNEFQDLDKVFIVEDNNSSQDSSRETTEKIQTTITTPRMHIKRKRSSNHSENLPLNVNVCEICGNQFNNRNVMNMHMKIHFQQKNHQCEICFKRFITACNLQAHMRIHTGEKPFECKYCGRRFNDRTSNLRHERTHTNEKPFKCASCGKTFTLATTLQNHIKVHTNERSYRCEPCGKSFKLPHHLKTHQNTSLHRSVLQIEDKDS